MAAKGRTVKAPMNTADDDEAEETSFEDSLTPLGKRAYQGYIARYGEEQGEAKFQQALRDGRLDKSKMLKSNSSNATKG